MISYAKILLVTNNRTTARDLQERLVTLGYQVAGVAVSEGEAMMKIEEFKPAVILTDILNKTDREIKTRKLIQTRYNLPVVYITQNIRQETIQRVRSTGPFGYIYQPFDDQQLLVTIETALTRHKLERKLSESRQWLNTTLTSIGDGIIATDEKGLVRFINPTAIKLTGWQHKEAIGKSLHEIFPLAGKESLKRLDIASIPKMENTNFEDVLFPRDEKSMPIEVNATPIASEKGEILGMVLVFRDISQQQAAIQEIERQAERAETLLQVASQVNSEIELETVLKKICEAATHVLKSAGAAILLKDVRRDVFRSVAVSGITRLTGGHGVQFEIPSSVFQSLMNSGIPDHVIMDLSSYPNLGFAEMLRKMNIQSIAMAPLDRHGEVIGILISFFSGRLAHLPEDEKKLLKGLADQAGVAITNASSFEQVRTSQERQQFLSRQLVKVQEEERRSLARELHDEIGQMLTALQFTLKSLMPNSNDEQSNKLDQAQIIVSAIISQIRELSINLRPSLLDDLGILPTLEWYFNRYEAKTGIQVHFQHQNLSQRFHTEFETAAFRIVQEALTNVARYSETAAVDVNIRVQNSVMQIAIEDWGCGFDVAGLAKNQSLGIEGMRERAYALGGLLEIQSELGKGTRVQASLPVSGHAERRAHEHNHSPGR